MKCDKMNENKRAQLLRDMGQVLECMAGSQIGKACYSAISERRDTGGGGEKMNND